MGKVELENSVLYLPDNEVDDEMIDWWEELDDDDKHMVLALTQAMAVGTKVNMFSVTESSSEIL